jgi:ABC-type maltose transport system permease subunit
MSNDRQTGHIIVTGRERWVNFALRWGAITLALVFALFPVVWIISAAFNPSGNLASQTLIPQNVESVNELFTNFRGVLVDGLDIHPYWNWMGNSLFIASITAVLTVMIAALSAYAFSRFRFTGRQNLLVLVLLIQVFPNMLAMVSLFLILQQIGKLAEYIPAALPFLAGIDWSFFNWFGLDSAGGLILIYLGGAMGINTWLMKGFFDSIPRDIDESAQVDGASHWQTFWMLIFPLVRPILAVVAILSFVGTFNEFVLARVMLRDKTHWTLMVGLYNYVSDNFARDWGRFAAGALIGATPIVVLYLLLQDQIVGGLTQGAVKG